MAFFFSFLSLSMSDSSLRRPTQVVRRRRLFPFGASVLGVRWFHTLCAGMTNEFSSTRTFRTGVFGHCTSSWWITFGCWSTKAISSSISRRKALSFALYSKASDPFFVMPIGYVSYSPIDVSPLDSGVLCSANPHLSGKGGLIVGNCRVLHNGR